MKTQIALVASLLLTSTPAMAAKTAIKPARPSVPETTKPDLNILHVQVILDKLGFAPGVLDGKGGQSLVAALKGFQTARGLPVTGKADAATQRALYPYRGWRPIVTLAITPEVLKGPFLNPQPKDPQEQAKLPGLYYHSALEALAERFHTTQEVIIALNSPQARLRPGARIVFPNALPTSRDYATKDDGWKATLSSLNVSAEQPQAAKVVVDKSDGVLQVYDAQDKLVAQFPATMGSEHDPLPLGTWKVQGTSYNPPFHFNPDLFWDAKADAKKALLPPGPNGPVGVAWIDISKPHYGIHGTPNPQTIGRAESHGCIRLTNWDVARLTLMVKSGVPLIFQE